MKAIPSKKNLRVQLREKRRSLSDSAQSDAAKNLAIQFTKLKTSRLPISIAAYSATDGEIDPKILISDLLNTGNSVALPCISTSGENRMSFAPISKNGTALEAMKLNRYGIDEPATQERINCSTFDLVLLPLVGFDKQGKRLGMGGGFYDRAFAFKKQRSNQKPYLIGLAHACQELDAIDSDEWDMPLDAVLTDQSYIPIKPLNF